MFRKNNQWLTKGPEFVTYGVKQTQRFQRKGSKNLEFGLRPRSKLGMLLTQQELLSLLRFFIGYMNKETDFASRNIEFEDCRAEQQVLPRVQPRLEKFIGDAFSQKRESRNTVFYSRDSCEGSQGADVCSHLDSVKRSSSVWLVPQLNLVSAFLRVKNADQNGLSHAHMTNRQMSGQTPGWRQCARREIQTSCTPVCATKWLGGDDRF